MRNNVAHMVAILCLTFQSRAMGQVKPRPVPPTRCDDMGRPRWVYIKDAAGVRQHDSGYKYQYKNQ